MKEVSVLLQAFAVPSGGDVGGHVEGGEARARAVNRNCDAAAETEIDCFVEHAALRAPSWQSEIEFLPVDRYYGSGCGRHHRIDVHIVVCYVVFAPVFGIVADVDRLVGSAGRMNEEVCVTIEAEMTENLF